MRLKLPDKVAFSYDEFETVDLDNIHENCDLDFEIELVQSPGLPASNHEINNNGETGNTKNLWTCP